MTEPKTNDADEAVLAGITTGLRAYDNGDMGAQLARLFGHQAGRTARVRAMLAEVLAATEGMDFNDGVLRLRARLVLSETE